MGAREHGSFEHVSFISLLPNDNLSPNYLLQEVKRIPNDNRTPNDNLLPEDPLSRF